MVVTADTEDTVDTVVTVDAVVAADNPFFVLFFFALDFFKKSTV
jgi:hypothetical protein